MEQPIYVLVETGYYGPILGFTTYVINFSGNVFDILEETLEEICTVAADEYHQLRENADVPYDVLWQSVKVVGISLYKTNDIAIEWRGEI